MKKRQIAFMARPIRIDVEDGVYHVISRGTDRSDLFREEADYVHFLDRLAEAQERFRLSIYSYVLMRNHFHLVVSTPDANLSQAIQWLKVSYSMWFNVKYQRSGPLFQGRFKGILVNGDENWLLDLSLYVHLNPVRVQWLGLDKYGKKREEQGWCEPTPAEVMARLAELQNFRWSSYPYYTGYKKKVPDWLDVSVISDRVESQEIYRQMAEQRICQGIDESFLMRMKDRIALGSEAYVEQIRRRCVDGQDFEGKRAMHYRYEWLDIVKMVEKEKGSSWEDFSELRGDWGRGAIYYFARKYTGMTLAEIGHAAGGVNYPAVSQMVKRFKNRLATDKALERSIKNIDQMLKIQT